MVYNYLTMAKYDSMRKLRRNELLREYAQEHPDLSLKEIGAVFNISESRVWRIIHKGESEDRQNEQAAF